MSEFTLLKRVARHIRYRKLDSLINQPIEIKSDMDELHPYLIQLALQVCTTEQILEFQPFNTLAYAKYGLIDIAINVSPELLEKDCHKGVRFLSEMGWLDKQGFSEDESMSCLQDVWNEISEGKAFIQLYLQAQRVIKREQSDSNDIRLDEGTKQILDKLRPFGLPLVLYPLPNTLVITDAFLTNASSIGMWRNFYL